MLREHAIGLNRLMMAVDAAVAAAAFLLAHLLVGQVRLLYQGQTYLWLLPAFVLTWLVLLRYLKMYDPLRMTRTPTVLWLVWKAGVLGFLIFGTCVFTLKAVHTSRLLVAGAFGLAMIMLGVEKIALIRAVRYWRARGYNQRYLLIVGTGKRAQRFIDRIRAHGEWGLKIVGLVDDDPALAGQTVEGCPVLGTLPDLSDILHRQVVDEVVFVVPRSWLDQLEPSVRLCEVHGVKVSLALDFFNLGLFSGRPSDFDGLPLLSFAGSAEQPWPMAMKRAIDVVTALSLLVVVSPLMGLIAAVIKVTSGGPVLFAQERCGLNGRRFPCYKFRTMVRDAEARLPALLTQNEMDGPVFKMSRDPRITGIGRWLRKFSLDELPQLWNVVRGEMSLVGPRPPLPAEVKRYDPWQRRKLSMRPGVTCLWQVSGRNRIRSFNDWVEMDLHYIDHWSLALDWKILLMTVPAVFLGTGAK